MNVVDGIITSLKREREPDRVYSFVQGIMELFARNFDEKLGDSFREEDVIILSNKDITIHKALGFDSSWCGSAGPSVVYGDQHPALVQAMNEK